MACGTIGPEFAVVMIVCRMAGEAGLRRAFQVSHSPRADMALITGQARMFAKQAKRCLVMIEVLSKRFNTVMAGHAVRTKGNEVAGREDQVDLQVTIAAGVLIEGHGKAVAMTVGAGEGVSIGMRLMSGQLEGRGAMIEHSR